MLEQRLAKMEKILLSSDSTQQTEEQEEKEQPRVKRGRPNKNSVDQQQQQQQQLPTSPASFSSVSSFPSPSMLLPQYSSSSSDDSNNGLPPVSTLEHFADLFFTHIHTFCPIMNETTFRRDIHEGKCSEFLLFCLSAACAR